MTRVVFLCLAVVFGYHVISFGQQSSLVTLFEELQAENLIAAVSSSAHDQGVTTRTTTTTTQSSLPVAVPDGEPFRPENFVMPQHWKIPSFERLDLETLAGSFDKPTEPCPAGLIRFNDTVIPPDEVIRDGRPIPRLVHFTSKSRCLTPVFVQNLQKWQFANHAVYLHDDAAVDRLLQRYWPQFPHLSAGISCLLSGAAKADLWRGLVLYEYGGIYSDVDNAPTRFDGETTLVATDEAFFVVESVGVLSQWFFASKPRHPLMYLLVQATLMMLMSLPEVDKQNVPRTTGPGALKVAMIHFMDRLRYNNRTSPYTAYERFQRVERGLYVGLDNATVRVVGHKRHQNDMVRRESVRAGDKHQGYRLMDMKHFSRVKPVSNLESCLRRIYRMHEKPQRQQGQDDDNDDNDDDASEN